jgi:hypothetical protein
MSRHSDNKKLIDAGLATDRASADKLRMSISGDIDSYIAAQGKETHHGAHAALPSGAETMSQVRALMYQEGLSFAAAESLRKTILSSGGTVSSYIEADAQPVNYGAGNKPGAMAVFRGAQSLIRLAGGPEEAKKAIDLFSQLETPVSPEGEDRAPPRRK